MMKNMRKKHASRMGMFERIEKEKNASYGGTSVGFLRACAKCEYFGNAIEPLSLKVKKESYSCGKHSRAVVHESIHKQDWNSQRIPVDCPFRAEMKLEEWNGYDA